jgi:enoyl-CoA hydratase/carnithine racemase
MSTYEQIIYEQEGYCATIKLNRPDKRNALTTEMFLEIFDALDRAEEESTVRVVVLTGQIGAIQVKTLRRIADIAMPTDELATG